MPTVADCRSVSSGTSRSYSLTLNERTIAILLVQFLLICGPGCDRPKTIPSSSRNAVVSESTNQHQRGSFIAVMRVKGEQAKSMPTLVVFAKGDEKSEKLVRARAMDPIDTQSFEIDAVQFQRLWREVKEKISRSEQTPSSELEFRWTLFETEESTFEQSPRQTRELFQAMRNAYDAPDMPLDRLLSQLIKRLSN